MFDRGESGGKGLERYAGHGFTDSMVTLGTGWTSAFASSGSGSVSRWPAAPFLWPGAQEESCLRVLVSGISI